METKTTKQILSYLIREMNWRNDKRWCVRECKEWVKGYFECSDYIARKVAKEIKNWQI